ncbi:hypothetical protein D3C71_2121870 [compost metagenome]
MRLENARHLRAAGLACLLQQFGAGLLAQGKVGTTGFAAAIVARWRGTTISIATSAATRQDSSHSQSCQVSTGTEHEAS